MRRVNEDFINKFFNIPGQQSEEQKKLEKQKRLQEYNSKARNSSFINEEAKNVINSSMNKIFENVKSKTTSQKSKSQGTWTQHLTPYGLFYHNKEKNLWANTFGKIADDLGELIEASSMSDVGLDYTLRRSSTETITITTSLATLSSPSNILDIAIPSLQANNIKYGHTVYNSDLGNLSDWLDVTCCGFDATIFKSRLQSHLTSYQSSSQSSGYNSYFKDIPEYLTLNTSYAPNQDELQEIIRMENDISNPSTNAAKAMNLAIGLITNSKQVSPQSKISQFSLPMASFYFLPVVGDSCTWYYKPIAVTQQQYEDEKARLLNLYKEKVETIGPPSDLITTRNYAAYSEYHLQNSYAFLDPSSVEFTKINSKIIEYANGKEVSTYVCPIIFPGSEYTLFTLSQGNYSLPEAQLKANTEALPNMIYSKEYMDRIILQPIKQSGIKSIHLWSGWDHWYTVAALPLSNSSTFGLTDADIYLYRKFINDLFEVTGIGNQIALDDLSSWQNPAVRETVMEAAIAKDLEMAESFRSL